MAAALRFAARGLRLGGRRLQQAPVLAAEEGGRRLQQAPALAAEEGWPRLSPWFLHGGPAASARPSAASPSIHVPTRRFASSQLRQLSPRFLDGARRSPASPPIYVPPTKPERLTLEEKWRLFERCADLMVRIASALTLFLVNACIIKIGINEVSHPGYLLRETSALVQKSKDMLRGLPGNPFQLRGLRGNPSEARVEYVIEDGTLEAKRAEFEAVLAELEAMVKKAKSRNGEVE